MRFFCDAARARGFSARAASSALSERSLRRPFAHSPKNFCFGIFRASGGTAVAVRAEKLFSRQKRTATRSRRENGPLAARKRAKRECGRARSFRPQGRNRRPFCDPVRALFFAPLFVRVLSAEKAPWRPESVQSGKADAPALSARRGKKRALSAICYRPQI